MVIAATKLDRLNKAKPIPASARAVALKMPETDVLGVSSTEELGMDELWRKLFAREGVGAGAAGHRGRLEKRRAVER